MILIALVVLMAGSSFYAGYWHGRRIEQDKWEARVLKLERDAEQLVISLDGQGAVGSCHETQ